MRGVCISILVVSAVATANSLPIDKEWATVASTITYAKDKTVHGVDEYWQTPEETLMLGTGDCEDYSILLVSMLRKRGIYAKIAIVDRGTYQHAMVLYNNVLVEPQRFGDTQFKRDIIKTYTLEEALKKCPAGGAIGKR